MVEVTSVVVVFVVVLLSIDDKVTTVFDLIERDDPRVRLEEAFDATLEASLSASLTTTVSPSSGLVGSKTVTAAVSNVVDGVAAEPEVEAAVGGREPSAGSFGEGGQRD